MTSSDYHFVTHWRVKGPLQVVFDVLRDGKNYCQWWKPAYVSSKELEPQKVESLVRAKLPYTLRFTSQKIREEPPHELEIRATGELEGAGLWKLKQEGDSVEISFFWDVRANKAVVRWFSFLLKPLFSWNHDWVMRTGEKALQLEVTRRLKNA
jgi:hypothetical protein